MSPIFSLCLLSFASSLLPWVVAPGNCPLPTRFEYGELEDQYLSLTEFPIGTTVTYKCRPGYILIRGKEKSITCLDTSAWSVIPEFCERRDCGSPGELLNGEFHLPVIEATGDLDTKFGSTATFTCNAGYKLLGRNTRTCGVSGWDNRVPICEVVVCFKPPDLQNGTHTDVDREEFMYQIAVVYTCNPGFSLIGKSTISCTANGTWSDLAPTCKIVSCSAPSVPNGEKISGFGPGPFKYKETVTFKCKEDFYMNGTALVQCNENSDWDPSLPSCVFRMPTSTTPATMTVTRKPDEKEDFSASTVQTTSSLFTKSKESTLQSTKDSNRVDEASTTQSTKDNNSKGGVPDRPRQVPDVTYKKKGTHTAGGVPDRPRQVPDVTYKKKGTHTAGPDDDNGAAHLIVGNMTLILAILVVKWLMLYSRS